jgi:dTDP-4-dehydrorhamnose reductase
MNNKILITGSGGFVGKNLYRILKVDYKVFGLSKSPGDSVDFVVDLSNEQECLEILKKIQPDIIVHCASFTNVDGAESDHEQADRNNITPVEILTQWAGRHNSRFVFISTDYVYDGSKGNFTETDPVNPLQYYGQTKAAGERIVSSLKNFVILRPTIIYGYDKDGKNFFMQILNNFKSGAKMVVPTDQINNPTSATDLCNLIKQVIAKPEINGIFISTGPEVMSRYEMACKVCDFFNWDKKFIIPKTTEEIGRPAPRPLNNSTISAKVCAAYNFNFRTLQENLKDIKQLITI